MTPEELIRAKVDLVQKINQHLAGGDDRGVATVAIKPGSDTEHTLFAVRIVNLSVADIITAARALSVYAAQQLVECECGADHSRQAQRLIDAAKLLAPDAACPVRVVN